MNKQTKTATGVIAFIVVIIITFGFLTMPDQRSTGQRVGDAIDAMPQGLDKAARQLEKRSPGEKLGDAVKDATDKN